MGQIIPPEKYFLESNRNYSVQDIFLNQSFAKAGTETIEHKVRVIGETTPVKEYSTSNKGDLKIADILHWPDTPERKGK